MSMDGGDVRLNLRISTDQVADDLQVVDKEIQRLQGLMQRAYNRSRQVRAGRSPAATSIDTVGENRGAWSPEVQRLDQLLNQRMRQLERAAKAGATSPPPTTAQQERHNAQTRLSAAAAAQQGRTLPSTTTTKPVLIDFNSTTQDKFKRAMMAARPDLMAMDAARGNIGGVGARILRLLGALGPEGMLAAGLAGGSAALGLGVNQSQVAFARQSALLASAAVGGPFLGGQRTALGLALADISPQFSVGGSAVQSMAQTLATGGVKPRDLIAQVKNALMLAGPNQIPYGDVANLTTSLATSGGLNAKGVNRLYQDVTSVAHDSGASILELVTSMKALSGTAIGAARDVGSLAAIQRLIGASSGVSAGSVMANVAGATGANAIQQAALLGMSTGSFMQAQGSKGGMAQIYDRIARFVKRLPGGPQGTAVAEQVLGQTGLLNFGGMNPQQQAALIQTLRSGKPGQAQALATQYQAHATQTALTQQQATANAARSMGHLAVITDKLSYAFQDVWTHLTNTDVGTPAQQRWRLTNATSPYNSAQEAYTAAFEHQGMMVPGARGQSHFITPELFRLYEAASTRTHVPLATLLAQGSVSGGFNPNTTTLGSIMSQAQVDAAAYKRTGHYSSDPSVATVAAETQHTLQVTVVVKDESGRVVQSRTDHHHVATTHRTPIGHKSHQASPPPRFPTHR